MPFDFESPDGTDDKQVHRSIKRRKMKLERTMIEAGPIIRQKKAFWWGNHDPYYFYRHSRVAEFDPRLHSVVASLGSDVFLDKDVFDAGCNSGFVSFLMSAVMGAKKVVGVDIDKDLIVEAVKQVRRFKTIGWSIEEPSEKKRWGHSNDIPCSLIRKRGPPSYSAKPWVVPLDVRVNQSDGDLKNRFPFNLEFINSDLLTMSLDVKFDVVVAFSIVKWVHLNNGDEGVKSLFQFFKEILKPGGFLILETEEWKGYKIKKRTSSKIRNIFENIKFRPCQFAGYLVETLNFQQRETIRPFRILPCFDRPILLFQKYP